MPLGNAGEVEKRVRELNAGWYNQINEALGLKPDNFLLAQGTLGLGTADGSGLYRMADVVPPSASVAYFDAGNMRSRAQAYEMLLNALLPEGGISLMNAMGPMYTRWVEYNNERIKDKTNKETFTEALERWSKNNLEPAIQVKVKTYIQQAENTPLNHALNALGAPGATQNFVAPDQSIYSLFVYLGATPEQALEAINGGTATGIAFDSNKMNTTLTHTTVEGSASGFYDIFSGGLSGEFEQLNTMAAFSDFKITGKIGASATLPVKYSNWYNSAEVERAQGAPNNFNIWNRNANAGNWEGFFDPNTGSLSRSVSQLILISDYDITVTSNAKYSAEQYQKIRASAKFGVWPFFSASGKATHETDYQQGAEGSLVVKHTLPRGIIQIWGVTISTLPTPKGA
jgi:hypothetical protein